MNEKYKEMNEKLNIEVCHTAGESPWSNGMVERHNAVLEECLAKVIQDAKCDPEIALAWSVSAKNSLMNQDGFSPDQLTYGRNNSFPSVLTDEPPAFESSTTVDIIRENMNAMHQARQAFIESEASERIKKALRHNIRSYANERYENGESVYYRRKNYKGWKGPGKVIGKDGQTVIVKHGSSIYRVHPYQLLKKKACSGTQAPSRSIDSNGPSKLVRTTTDDSQFDSDSESDSEESNDENDVIEDDLSADGDREITVDDHENGQDSEADSDQDHEKDLLENTPGSNSTIDSQQVESILDNPDPANLQTDN